MFTKITTVKYLLNAETAAEIYAEIKNDLDSSNVDIVIDKTTYENTIKEILSYRTALLVVKHLNVELLRAGFLAVTYRADINFEVSVAYIDGSLAYGVLIR